MDHGSILPYDAAASELVVQLARWQTLWLLLHPDDPLSQLDSMILDIIIVVIVMALPPPSDLPSPITIHQPVVPVQEKL